MINNDELVRLVKKAQLGDKECLNRLAEAARVRLREYVFRLTLQEDLTQDIVQESILEMFRVFNKLKKAERFWSWLHGIAFNKTRSHYGRQWRRRTTSLSDAALEVPARDSQNALAGLINRELKQVVIRSMQELAPRHRAVLTMRCYEQMPYAKIAEVLGCSEFSAQSLFYRAKKSLARKLSRHGLGKQYLLAALILFGKMTATTEATAVKVSVTAASLKVGAAASVASMVAGKTGVLSLATAGVIAGGAVATLRTTETGNGLPRLGTHNSLNTSQRNVADKGMEQCWYFFPEGPGKPMMTRLVTSGASGKSTYCQLLQNQHANYYYRKNTIFVKNARMFNTDLSVRRLPTDSADLTRFISHVEGARADMEYIDGRGKGLLVISKRTGGQGNRIWRIDRHFNVLEEEYFQFDWPASATIVDNRDAMHQRGWTYFRISGRVNGEQVSGSGRMPFVYAASMEFSPWLEIRLAGGLKIVDDGARAYVLDAGRNTIASYAGGSFFKGLGRPWMGLHAIDTVRRDAAEEHLGYETKYLRSNGRAQVALTCEQVRFFYIIDMRTDVIEGITVTRKDGGWSELKFSYLQDVDSVGNEFVRPNARGNTQTQQQSPGMLWLATMAESR
ncbi:MAG: RNA polymerase sigma factor [Planctomycetota bacterium]|jgi:RNA polymerase sigma-70 factor (ECF subfamily)